MAMSKPLDHTLARTPVIALKTPGGKREGRPQSALLRPAWENAIRRLEPGPTSGGRKLCLQA
jgi:hypothetical protein